MKSKSAECLNSRTAASSFSSSSGILESYQTNVRNASLNSRQFYSAGPPGTTPPPPSQYSSKRLHSTHNDTASPEAHIRPVPRQGTGHIPARPEVRDRDQHPSRRRDQGSGLGAAGSLRRAGRTRQRGGLPGIARRQGRTGGRRSGRVAITRRAPDSGLVAGGSALMSSSRRGPTSFV